MDKVERAREIARIIDPHEFKAWQSLYDYCIRTGDSEEDARGTADWAHKKGCDEAIAKAESILAALEPLGEALLEAITPSADTKAAYIGEVKDRICVLDEDGEEEWVDHTISWDATKEIMKLIRARVEAALREPSND